MRDFVDGLTYRKFKFDFVWREKWTSYTFVLEITPEKAKNLYKELLYDFYANLFNMSEYNLAKYFEEQNLKIYALQKKTTDYHLYEDKFLEKDLYCYNLHKRDISELINKTVNSFAGDSDYHYLLFNNGGEVTTNMNGDCNYQSLLLLSTRELSKDQETEYEYRYILQKAHFNDLLNWERFHFAMGHISQLEDFELYNEKDVEHLEMGKESLIIPIHLPEKGLADNTRLHLDLLKDINTIKTKEEIIKIVEEYDKKE